MKHVGEKGVLTGTPIRSGLFAGSAEKARAQYGLDNKPVILIIGGSLGAAVINENIREILPKLLDRFNVVHICGKGNMAEMDVKGYVQLEFITEGLADLFALADVVISRAGANSIFEFLALHKPMLLIPLSRAQSRGDQCDNAESFQGRGYAAVLEQESMTPQTLYTAVLDLYENRQRYITAMEQAENTRTGTESVMNVIRSVMG
jgi:UDP-N-acetylglucosamine--N-acetylmuramyl-(pentapeptide) pyrophosphoryl-undecaprenol N-acetylglucosamine transferase